MICKFFGIYVGVYAMDVSSNYVMTIIILSPLQDII